MIARHIINRQEVSPAVVQQEGVTVLASFENDNVQANISSEQFTFILEAYQIIKDHIDQGRIFEPLPYKLEAVDKGNRLSIFDGQLSLYKSPEMQPLSSINAPTPAILATLEKKDGLNNLFDNLEAIDWDFLDSEGALSAFQTFEYVVEDYYSAIELIILGAQAFSFTFSIIDNSYKIATAIAQISGLTGAGVTGSIGAAIYAIAQAIALGIYNAALAAALYKIIIEVKRTYLLPKRTGKCQYLGTLIRDALTYLGYTLKTDISELDTWAVASSNPNLDSLFEGYIETPQGPDKGYPRVGDPGHNCLEFFDLMRDTFNAKLAIKGSEVWMYRALSPVWLRNANYQIPDKEAQPYSYNTSDLRSIYTISFAFDYSDVFTIQRSSDRVYSQSYKSKGQTNTIRGRDVTEIPFSLAERKNSLNAVEKTVEALINTANTALGIFGLSISGKPKNKIGAMRIGTNNWNTPKIFPLSGQKMPADYKNKLSAQYLWDNYHYDKSPLNPRRQRLQYSVEAPFSLSDFNQTIENSYFRDNEGRFGRITKIEWEVNKDVAKIDYYIEEQYTDRITEKRIL